MKNYLILIAAVIGMTSCATVPSLVTSTEAKQEYLGQHEDMLIQEYGLPDNESLKEDGTKVWSWELGSSSTTAATYWGYGAVGGRSEVKQNRFTAYIDSDGYIQDVRTFGYELGNQEEVDSAKRINTYLGIVYGSAAFTTILTWLMIPSY